MKRLAIIAFALAIATSAIAAPAAAKAHYSGIIEKYDAATKTLTIKHGDKQGDFVLTDASEMTQSGKKADASALTAGQKIEVEFSMDGAKKVVHKAKLSGGAATTKK